MAYLNTHTHIHIHPKSLLYEFNRIDYDYIYIYQKKTRNKHHTHTYTHHYHAKKSFKITHTLQTFSLSVIETQIFLYVIWYKHFFSCYCWCCKHSKWNGFFYNTNKYLKGLCYCIEMYACVCVCAVRVCTYVRERESKINVSTSHKI